MLYAVSSICMNFSFSFLSYALLVEMPLIFDAVHEIEREMMGFYESPQKP